MCNWEGGDACSSKFSVTHTLKFCASLVQGWLKRFKVPPWRTHGSAQAVSIPQRTTMQPRHGCTAVARVRFTSVPHRIPIRGDHLRSILAGPSGPRCDELQELTIGGRRVPDQCQVLRRSVGISVCDPNRTTRKSDKLSQLLLYKRGASL